jgi:uncharacterized membrane protein YkoI
MRYASRVMHSCRLLVVVVSLLGASVAAAGTPAPPPESRTISIDEAVKKVELQYHARVVKAESQQGDGRTTYVLRLLNDSGKVWTVHVDANSGAVQ